MDREKLERDVELLEESIQHWRRKYVHTKKWSDIKIWGKHSPLCGRYYKDGLEIENTCRGCPIRENTGTCCCDYTPWLLVSLLRNRWKSEGRKPAEMEAAVQKEIHFLEKLKAELEQELQKGEGIRGELDDG